MIIYKAIKVGINYLKNKSYAEYVDLYNQPYSLSISEKGEKRYGEIVYFIGMKDLNGIEENMGFFALFNCVLNRLYYADRLGLVPVVRYPDTVLYYDDSLKDKYSNVWDYYFEPVSDVTYEDVLQAKNLCISEEKHSQFNLKYRPGYLLDDEGINNLASVWKKYIHFNKKINEMLNGSLEILDSTKKIIGVHVRGTDFKMKNKNHPKAISLKQYIEAIKKLIDEHSYSFIFVACDEMQTIVQLKQFFGDKIIFCEDVERSQDGTPVHKSYRERYHHNYLLGWEVLRDMYLLAHCDALIAGRSQVSLAVRIYKRTLGSDFESEVILDNGIYLK